MSKKATNETKQQSQKPLTLEQLQQVSGGRGGVNNPRGRGRRAN
jgi:bacteriocin-like protein